MAKPQAIWALLLGTVGFAACQGRSQQPVVIGQASTTAGTSVPGASTGTSAVTSPFQPTAANATAVQGAQIPGGAATPAAASTLSASAQAVGKTYVNGWDGANDCDNAHQGGPGCASVANWNVTTAATTATAASATPSSANATAATTTPPAATTTTTSSSSASDPSARALQLVQASCGSSCHAGGGQAPDLSTAANITQQRSAISASLSSMFPKASPPVSAADQQVIQSWASGSGGGAAGGAAAATTNADGTKSVTLTLTGDEGSCYNRQAVTANQGDKIHIVNNCTVGWIPHPADGSGFFGGHGSSEVAANGGTGDYIACNPGNSTNGSGATVWRHIGPDNTAEGINLTVSPVNGKGDCASQGIQAP